ncbi:MAG: squalene/phytoene synthase family protein [Pseudomonadota bacterium]
MNPSRFAPLSRISAEYLLDEVAKVEPDWLLVLPYVDDARRAAWLTACAFAAELISVSARVSAPLPGQIRLQWWRDALEELRLGAEPRRHPVVDAMAETQLVSSTGAPTINAMIDAMEGFLAPGEDRTIDGAIASRLGFYGALASLLSGSPSPPVVGEALALHALNRVSAASGAVPKEGGVETPAGRFARALAVKPDLASKLAECIAAYRASTNRQPPESCEHLVQLPLALVRTRRGAAYPIRQPLLQRLVILRSVLTGKI